MGTATIFHVLLFSKQTSGFSRRASSRSRVMEGQCFDHCESTQLAALRSHTHTRARRYKKQSKTINKKTEEEEEVLDVTFFHVIEEEENL